MTTGIDEFCRQLTERLTPKCVIPPEIIAKPDTWRNLYPNIKDRGLAFLYSLLHRVAPRYFITETLTPSWLTRVFPFKCETIYDDLTETEQEIYKIQFGNRGCILIDVRIYPVQPIQFIKFDIEI